MYTSKQWDWSRDYVHENEEIISEEIIVEIEELPNKELKYVKSLSLAGAHKNKGGTLFFLKKEFEITIKSKQTIEVTYNELEAQYPSTGYPNPNSRLIKNSPETTDWVFDPSKANPHDIWFKKFNEYKQKFEEAPKENYIANPCNEISLPMDISSFPQNTATGSYIPYDSYVPYNIKKKTKIITKEVEKKHFNQEIEARFFISKKQCNTGFTDSLNLAKQLFNEKLPKILQAEKEKIAKEFIKTLNELLDSYGNYLKDNKKTVNPSFFTTTTTSRVSTARMPSVSKKVFYDPKALQQPNSTKEKKFSEDEIKFAADEIAKEIDKTILSEMLGDIES